MPTNPIVVLDQKVEQLSMVLIFRGLGDKSIPFAGINSFDGLKMSVYHSPGVGLQLRARGNRSHLLSYVLGNLVLILSALADISGAAKPHERVGNNLQVPYWVAG